LGPLPFGGPPETQFSFSDLFRRIFLNIYFSEYSLIFNKFRNSSIPGPPSWGSSQPLTFLWGGGVTPPTPPISSAPAGAELCRSCEPPAHQLAWLLQTLAWLLYLNGNCCSQFAYHHVVTQITVSHFVSNIFWFIMKNNTPLHPSLVRARGTPHPAPPVNPSLIYKLINKDKYDRREL
jgi:hypothetical protein